ncbi:MAG: 7-carboxy-7-deazaguanine synthase QueE [Balneolaceae bacterium]|nr:7-carboxy-7-deazaguanine synthase QueE [Balneolaceae bacterium]
MYRAETATPNNAGTSGRKLSEVAYPVMEHFLTIQGEGVHTGKAAYFIRTAGCDVNCWWCDVQESWDEEKHPPVTVGELVEAASESGAPMAVLTGGEPLLHDLGPLTRALRQAGLRTHLETSGSSPMSGHVDWVTLSPKRFKKPLKEAYACADELKVVVLTAKDLAWAESCAARCPNNTRLLLQPEWSRSEEAVPLIFDYIKQHPQWEISLQTHKFMGVR